MDVSQYVLIAGAMLLLAVLLIGSGIAVYMNQRKKEPERIAEEKRALLENTAPKPAENPLPAQMGDKVEILRVLRDPLDGQLVVQVLGKSAGTAGEMDARQRAQVRRAIGELVRWMDMPEEAAGAGEDATAGRVPDEVDQETTEAAEIPEQPAGGYFADSLPERVELKDVLPFRRKNIPKLKEAPPPPLSIVEQIDEILQEKLAQSPLAGTRVWLSEEQGGGLKIHVGDHEYLSIDDVAEAYVRQLIKSAVREWNEKNRHSPTPPAQP